MSRLSEKRAVVNVNAIGIFYIISGIWEYLIGLTQAESIGPNIYFLLDVYRNYAMIIGGVTILIGLGLLFKINLARLLAIILAWLNLLTSPLIGIWWNIYAIVIKKFSATDSWLSLWLYSFILILIMSAIRLYIIYILRVSKVGYIFLKKKE